MRGLALFLTVHPPPQPMHDAWRSPTSLFAMNANLWPSFLERHYGHFFFRRFESLANVLKASIERFSLYVILFNFFDFILNL